MYRIVKIINNNIVSSVDDNGEEIILRGLGIGFKHKVHEQIPESEIEKIYKLSNQDTHNKLKSLLEDIPVKHLDTAIEIIEYAKKKMNRMLNEGIYLSLTDHINFAIIRFKRNQSYKNPMFIEIKRFYRVEYEIGLKALEIIHTHLGVQLPVDEAAFIALHFVNANLDTQISDMYYITEMIDKTLNLIKDYYKIHIDEQSIYYDRLVTHLKFFGQRLFSCNARENQMDNKEQSFFEMIKQQYAKDYNCALLIKEFIKADYSKNVTEEELIFLTVHLRRITEI